MGRNDTTPSFADLENLDDLKGPTGYADEPLTDDPDALAMTLGTGRNEATVAKYEEPCKACRGSGNFISYSGRIVGPCYKCKGKGKRYYRTSPETREKSRQAAQARKERKAQEKAKALVVWVEGHQAEVDYIVSRMERWSFMASLHDAILKFGRLTDGQLAAVRRAMEKDAARDRQQAEAQATGLDLTPLPDGRYAVPGGDTRLKVMVRRPGKQSKWHGYIFVSDAAEYGSRTSYGRQVPGGRYQGKITEQLETIMRDPEAAMAAYGHLTGTCGMCGRRLEDEESVARGIGPICAAKL